MTLRLTDDEADALRRRAESEQRSMQEVARSAVREYVERHEHEDDVDEAADWVVTNFREALGASVGRDPLSHALRPAADRGVDGNERLAWAATAVFLVLNGRPPRVDQDALFDLVMAVADGTLDDVPAIVARLEPLC